MADYTLCGEKLKELAATMEKVKKCIKLAESQEELVKINQKIDAITDWQNSTETELLMREKSRYEKIINGFTNTLKKITDNLELLEMCEQEPNEEESQKVVDGIFSSLAEIEAEVRKSEVASMFGEKEDTMPCFLEINAGAGGTDCQDWVEIMLRMYLMWADKNGFKYAVVDKTAGEEAGLKNVTIEVEGDFAFGYLKNENGVHRLVRISPFNSSGKRQTSFASVFCYPAVNNETTIEINDKDLRIDTYRSSGAGGQHVNKTDSAVRITHIPTKTVVQSQDQRSQLQNRAVAMKMLTSRLYNLELQKQKESSQKIEDAKTDISWGHQVRNYVLHPYKLVKDLRSGYETGNTENVLNGGIADIIESIIISKAQSGN